jgi:soluble lytic murein transglycosylase-like protein
MSAIVMAGAPGLHHTTRSANGAVPTTVVAETVPTPAPVVAKPAVPDKRTLTAYLAREWKLGKDYAAQVASAVLSAGQRNRVDPVLLLAIAATESRLQHSVGNPGGGSDPMKPYGIMQVAGQYHIDKFPGKVVRRTSVRENIDIGAKVYGEYLALERGNERRALLRYNGSLNVSDKYFRKVNRFRQRLSRELYHYQREERESSPA